MTVHGSELLPPHVNAKFINVKTDVF
jgi:hypothetical protein